MERLWDNLLEQAYKNKFFLKARKDRAKKLVNSLGEMKGQVLEVGTGKGDMYKLMSENGINVITIDVKDQVISANDDIKTKSRVIADGLKLPFKNQAFDLSIICLVLHHLPGDDAAMAAVRESLRVSRQLMVIEDSVDPPLNKTYVKTMDKLLNIGVPGGAVGGQKTISEWEQLMYRYHVNMEIVRKRVQLPIFGMLPWEINVFKLSL